MRKRHQARAARRAARQLAAGTTASGLPTAARLPAAGGPTHPTPTPVGTCATDEPQRAAPPPGPRPTFSDVGLTLPGAAGPGTLGGSAAFGCFADGPRAGAPFAAPPPGHDPSDGRTEVPFAGPGRTQAREATGDPVQRVDTDRHDPTDRRPHRAYVETYLNLGTDHDYCWTGPVMGRRNDADGGGGGAPPGHPAGSGQVSTETV